MRGGHGGMSRTSGSPDARAEANPIPGQHAVTEVRELAEAVRAARWEKVDDLLNERFYTYLLTDREGVHAAFAALPEEWFDAYPRHRMTREIAFATGSMQLLNDGVQRGFTDWVLAQESPAARDRLALHTTQMRTMLATGSYHRAAEKADDIHELVETATDTNGFHDVLPSVMLRAGQAKLHVGDLSAASGAFMSGHRWANSRGTHAADRFIRSHLALVDALHGDLVLAKAWFHPTDDDEPVGGDGLVHQLKTADLLIRALVSVGSDPGDEAEEALRRVSYEHSNNDLWWVGAHARALYELQWGEPRRGIAHLEQALRNYRSATAPDLLAGQLLRADLASLYQIANELDAAERVLRTPNLSRAHVLVRAAHARQHLLKGRPSEAAVAIEPPHGGGSGELAPVTSVLHAVIEHAESGKASERTISRAADHIRSSGALYAVQEAVEPTRGRILSRLNVSSSLPRVQYPYNGVITVDLSQRESEVLAALTRHESVAAIASELHLSTNTVKTYKRSLYRKLGARTRAEALEHAATHGPFEGRSRRSVLE